MEIAATAVSTPTTLEAPTYVSRLAANRAITPCRFLATFRPLFGQRRSARGAH
jgi:hypothetical protein